MPWKEPILSVAVCDPTLNDLALTRAIVRKALDTLSIRCRSTVHAYPAPEALLAARPCDICITELELGAMDGFQLAEAVRRRRPGAEIIFVTRRGENATTLKAFHIQVAQYFVKPIECKEDYTGLKNALNVIILRLTAAAPLCDGRESER